MIRDGCLAVSAGLIISAHRLFSPPFFFFPRAGCGGALDFPRRKGRETWAQAAQGRNAHLRMADGGPAKTMASNYKRALFARRARNHARAGPPLWRSQASRGAAPRRPAGMHPALKALQPLWQAQKLAVVGGGPAIPNPNSPRHSVSVSSPANDIWQTLDLSPGKSCRAGLGQIRVGRTGRQERASRSIRWRWATALPTAFRARLNVPNVPVVIQAAVR